MPDLAEQILRGAVAAGIVYVALAVPALLWQAYWPLNGHRRTSLLLREGTLYRYAARDTIQEHGDGTITLVPHKASGLASFGPGYRTGLYFYAGHRRRGGRLNAQRKKTLARAPQDVVLIDARDFLDAYTDAPMRWRPWDRAIAVRDPYTGPARIVRDVDHASARRSAIAPA